MHKEMYMDILRRFRDAVRRKRPEIWGTYSWFLLHDSAPAHRSILAKDSLTKKSVTTLELRPYPPDLAPADFYLLIRLKSALKGRPYCDATDVTKNATEELKKAFTK